MRKIAVIVGFSLIVAVCTTLADNPVRATVTVVGGTYRRVETQPKRTDGWQISVTDQRGRTTGANGPITSWKVVTQYGPKWQERYYLVSDTKEEVWNPPTGSYGQRSVLRVAGNNPSEPNPWVNTYMPENPVDIGGQCGSDTWVQGDAQQVSVAVVLDCIVTITGGSSNNDYAVTIWGVNGTRSAVLCSFLSSGGSTLVTLSGAVGGRGLWTVDSVVVTPNYSNQF